MAETILVTGAPGNVGSEVVRGLISSGANVRVGAFDVELARKLFGDGVDVVKFDFLDPQTYSAFDGVSRMFLVRPPALSDVPKQIAPAVQAAVNAGVKHIVFLSLQGVENNHITPHYKIEQLIKSLDVTATFLRASFFMQNLSTTHRDEIRREGQIVVPVSKAKTSFIDVRDIAAVAVKALTESGHENKAYTLTGAEAIDYFRVAQIMTDVLKKPVCYANPSIITFVRRQLAKGNSLGYTAVVTALYTITRFGNAAEVTPDVRQLLGRDPISFRRFVEDHQSVWG